MTSFTTRSVAAVLLTLPAVLATASPSQWYWGHENCTGNVTEPCLGTEVWCFMKTINGEYESTEACYSLRQQMDWFNAANDGCKDDSERCLGTEAFCGRVGSRWDRDRCIGARKKTPWLDAHLDSCPASGPKTELCMGTKAWCQREEAWKYYSSEEVCRSHRSRSLSWTLSPEDAGNRMPSVPAGDDFDSCKDPYSEKCMGTELYCMGKSSHELRESCLQERQPLRYYHRFSTDCRDKVDDGSEACVGSIAWCKHEDRIKLWGSRQDCLKFRSEPPQLMPLHYKSNQDDCKYSQEERCIGTEAFCMKMTGRSQRKQCFESREPHLFLAANSNICSGKGGEEERCVGTVTWCKKHFYKRHYDDADECFQVRGFMYNDLKKIARKWLEGRYKDEILVQGRMLGRASFFIELGQLHLTNETAQQLRERVRYTLSRFVHKLWRDARRTAEKGVRAFVQEKRS
ncbi:hypothetical protein CP533_1286 [Ophiocordyceps camponoti-saundersi (nom. inval.)]|nr:hypothetical protein CP533_1286 [Ophiocordyceps camponoti-saundersi (nom. inval.)]